MLHKIPNLKNIILPTHYCNAATNNRPLAAPSGSHAARQLPGKHNNIQSCTQREGMLLILRADWCPMATAPPHPTPPPTETVIATWRMKQLIMIHTRGANKQGIGDTQHTGKLIRSIAAPNLYRSIALSSIQVYSTENATKCTECTGQAYIIHVHHSSL